MKTKNMKFLIGFLLLTGNAMQAQTNYYNVAKTFYEDGYVYQCDIDATTRVTLYNKENKYTYERLVFKDGSDANGAIFFNGMKPLEKDDWTRSLCGTIADKFFSFAERSRVKDKGYNINMKIDSSTGKVIEVDFSFLVTSPFCTIPVSTFRKIELELKNKIWFTPTTDGKKMKFILVSWSHTVSRLQPIPIDSNPIPLL